LLTFDLRTPFCPVRLKDNSPAHFWKLFFSWLRATMLKEKCNIFYALKGSNLRICSYVLQ
jgi:hypothetical protein